MRAEAAEAWYRLGFIESEVGTPAEAAKRFQEAAAMYDALARDHPGEPSYPDRLARALEATGEPAVHARFRLGCAAVHAASVEILRRAAIENPQVPEYQNELGTGLMNCGYQLERAGRAAESMPLYNEARDLYRTPDPRSP